MKEALREIYSRNIAVLRREVGDACRRSGRDPEEVTIVAAAKYAGPEEVKLVRELGIKDFGENRSDDLLLKKSSVEQDAVWHFIGHLQSRKARDVVPAAEYIHSIDTLKTLEKVSREAKKCKKVQKVLAEVNISGEETKYGLMTDNVVDFIAKAEKIDHIELKGLMTMAPFTDDMEYIRDIFRSLRKLRDSICSTKGPGSFTELSMGMTNDFKVAIEEGATMIRVGSIIFKQR